MPRTKSSGIGKRKDKGASGLQQSRRKAPPGDDPMRTDVEDQVLGHAAPAAPAAAAAPSTPSRGAGYDRGVLVWYNSASHAAWLTAIVTRVCAEEEFLIDIRQLHQSRRTGRLDVPPVARRG